MKILLTILTFGCTLMYGLSQEIELKPDSGQWTTEVNFSPLGSTPISISGIRVRKFNEQKAFRAIVFLSHSTTKPVEDVTLSTTEFSFKPGQEYHFDGTKRLSPYIGFELDLALKGSTYKSEGDVEVEIKGAWDQSGTEQGYFRFGANFIIGGGFYISESIYLGTEVGFGFSYLTQNDIETTSEVLTEDVIGGSAFTIGPNYNGSIRLGYAF